MTVQGVNVAKHAAPPSLLSGCLVCHRALLLPPVSHRLSSPLPPPLVWMSAFTPLLPQSLISWNNVYFAWIIIAVHRLQPTCLVNALHNHDPKQSTPASPRAYSFDILKLSPVCMSHRRNGEPANLPLTVIWPYSASCFASDPTYVSIPFVVHRRRLACAPVQPSSRGG